MKIVKKEKRNYLFSGLMLVVSGALIMIYLIETRGDAGDFSTVFGKLASLVSVIIGIVYLVRYSKFYQERDEEFDIKDNTLYFQDKSYPLQDSFLSLQFRQTPNADMFRVTLFLQYNQKTQKVFEHIVFDAHEMATFLKLIKPYRKSKTCLVDEEHWRIELFQEGFMYEKREIFYDEVEKFDTIFIDTKAAWYMDIDIVLKSGEKIDARLSNGYKEYARAQLAALFVQANGKEIPQIECTQRRKWGVFIAIIDIVIIALIYISGDEVFQFFGLVMGIVTYFYVTSSIDLETTIKICQEMKALQKKVKR